MERIMRQNSNLNSYDDIEIKGMEEFLIRLDSIKEDIISCIR